jgi:hypothetical protein
VDNLVSTTTINLPLQSRAHQSAITRAQLCAACFTLAVDDSLSETKVAEKKLVSKGDNLAVWSQKKNENIQAPFGDLLQIKRSGVTPHQALAGRSKCRTKVELEKHPTHTLGSSLQWQRLRCSSCCSWWPCHSEAQVSRLGSLQRFQFSVFFSPLFPIRQSSSVPVHCIRCRRD